jgi:hypothetical protein
MKNMKIAILIVFLNSVLFTFSQDVEKQKLYESKTGWTINRNITNSTDTSYFFYWAFRNAEYSAIIDMGSIFLTSREEVESFANKLKEFALKPPKVEVSSTLNVVLGKITFTLHDFSNSIYIRTDDSKYFMYSKKASLKVAEEILLNLSLMP